MVSECPYCGDEVPEDDQIIQVVENADNGLLVDYVWHESCWKTCE